jgi:hypothetical protein
MRAKEIPGMVALGSGVYVRPEEIVCIVAYRHPIPVPSRDNVIDATPKGKARLRVHIRNGPVIFLAITSRTMIAKLRGETPAKKKIDPEKWRAATNRRRARLMSIPADDEGALA